MSYEHIYWNVRSKHLEAAEYGKHDAYKRRACLDAGPVLTQGLNFPVRN